MVSADRLPEFANKFRLKGMRHLAAHLPQSSIISYHTQVMNTFVCFSLCSLNSKMKKRTACFALGNTFILLSSSFSAHRVIDIDGFGLVSIVSRFLRNFLQFGKFFSMNCFSSSERKKALFSFQTGAVYAAHVIVLQPTIIKTFKSFATHILAHLAHSIFENQKANETMLQILVPSNNNDRGRRMLLSLSVFIFRTFLRIDNRIDKPNTEKRHRAHTNTHSKQT